MPAASAEKCVQQRANKLQQMETEATTTQTNVLPPASAQTAEITCKSQPTPASTSFTIPIPILNILPAPTCQLVCDMGNPWVFLPQPVPLPTRYPDPQCGEKIGTGLINLNPK